MKKAGHPETCGHPQPVIEFLPVIPCRGAEGTPSFLVWYMQPKSAGQAGVVGVTTVLLSLGAWGKGPEISGIQKDRGSCLSLAQRILVECLLSRALKLGHVGKSWGVEVNFILKQPLADSHP